MLSIEKCKKIKQNQLKCQWQAKAIEKCKKVRHTQLKCQGREKDPGVASWKTLAVCCHSQCLVPSSTLVALVKWSIQTTMNNHDFKRRKMYFRLSCTSCLLDMECGEGLVWPLNLSAGGKTHKKTSVAKSLWRAQSTKRAGRAALADPGSPTFHVVLLTTQCFPSFLIYLPILLISNQTVSHKTWRIEIWPIHQKSNCKILLPSLLSFN